MTTAEKILRAKTDLDDTYNAGYEKGKAEGGGIDYMPYMQTIRFSQTATAEITENVSLNLSSATGLLQIIEYTDINFNKFTVKITSLCKSFQNAFRTNNTYVDNLEEIEIIGDTSGVTSFINAFNGRKTLKKIIGELDFSNVTAITNAFGSCSSLQSITPKANTIKVSTSLSSSPNLTNESKQAIFDGLSTVETTQTLTLNNQVKILQSQVDSANTKGWTVAGGTVVSEEEYYG